MKFGIAIELILLAAGFARGDDRPAFRVESKCPPAFVVVDKTAGCYCGDSCKCKAGECPAKCPVAPAWYAAPFAAKHPKHATPPGYPPAAPGFHWAKFPGDIWGLVQDGCEVPKTYAAPAPAARQACPTGNCPLNRR